ncbi:DNA-binding response regulator [Nocardiopsis kunsanensis]|uniref:DNA-binding response regulator n=2 Tax=Nocardiopsis kunsanensis TaxID=141693 RepID=A0A918XL57_9ACTN|nr:DNA-binding response regulator [Nocardiopsis kunsanensis]
MVAMNSTTPETIQVLIVDDDPLVRSGLRIMLGGAPDLLMVAEAADGSEVLDQIDLHEPDIVLMDIRMRRLDGLSATRALRARPNPPQVIVLTTFDADHYVLGALRAGAAGFLLKDTPPEEIITAVRHAARGLPVLSPEVTRRLIARVTEPEEDERRTEALDRLAGLSEREQEVALAVARGLSNAEIAQQLHFSVSTVKTHTSRLLATLGFNNRVQIAILVHEAGLLQD